MRYQISSWNSSSLTDWVPLAGVDVGSLQEQVVPVGDERVALELGPKGGLVEAGGQQCDRVQQTEQEMYKLAVSFESRAQEAAEKPQGGDSNDKGLNPKSTDQQVRPEVRESTLGIYQENCEVLNLCVVHT